MKKKIEGTFFAGVDFPECCAQCPGCTDYSEDHDDTKHFCSMRGDLPTLDEKLMWVTRLTDCPARRMSMSEKEFEKRSVETYYTSDEKCMRIASGGMVFSIPQSQED